MRRGTAVHRRLGRAAARPHQWSVQRLVGSSLRSTQPTKSRDPTYELFRGRHEALDGGCEVAAPVLPSHHRPDAMTLAGRAVGGRLGHRRIVAAQAALLLLLLG